MKELSGSTSNGYEKYSFQKEDRQGTVLRLRQQSWLAAVLLLSPWLLTIFLCLPIFHDHPATTLALLPGLAVAVRILAYLSLHLGSNHRLYKGARLFPSLGAANWITLLRTCAVVSLAGSLPIAIQQGHELQNVLTWAPGIVYLGISLADLLDGFVARKQRRETELGKRLDIETDAAGLLVASLLAIALDRLPAIYLLAGLAYYPFILGTWVRQKRTLPVITLQPRPFARIIAGFQMGFVGMALLPILNPNFTFMAAVIFMTPFLIGFLRDWLVVSCRLKTDTAQQSTLDRRARSLMMKTLPMTLRLIVLAGGVTTLVGHSVYQTHPHWQLAHSFCCLLASIGFMGRSAGLVLILLLGSNQSPFGMSLVSTVIFCTAATLMLIGTGAMALWAPEEIILYRRKKNGLIRP